MSRAGWKEEDSYRKEAGTGTFLVTHHTRIGCTSAFISLNTKDTVQRSLAIVWNALSAPLGNEEAASI